jgi:ferredoxin
MRYILAYQITDACINCGACEEECPVEAILEKDRIKSIDPEKCQECGACAIVCPTEAIVAN